MTPHILADEIRYLLRRAIELLPDDSDILRKQLEHYTDAGKWRHWSTTFNGKPQHLRHSLSCASVPTERPAEAIIELTIQAFISSHFDADRARNRMYWAHRILGGIKAAA